MNRTLPNWRPRRVGVFISQNQDKGANGASIDETPWTCLVLVEPLEMSQNELAFCYRKVVRSTNNYPPPNARCVDGDHHYTIEESDLQGLITYLVKDLLERHFKGGNKSKEVGKMFEEKVATRCAKLLTELGKDVFWGWEEFTTQVVQFSAV